MTSPVSAVEAIEKPVRIWAYGNNRGSRVWTPMKPVIAGAHDEQEYVRADIHDALALKAEANEQLAIANGQRAREEHFRAEDAERQAEALQRENAELRAMLERCAPAERSKSWLPVPLWNDARALLGGSDAE